MSKSNFEFEDNTICSLTCMNIHYVIPIINTLLYEIVRHIVIRHTMHDNTGPLSTYYKTHFIFSYYVLNLTLEIHFFRVKWAH